NTQIEEGYVLLGNELALGTRQVDFATSGTAADAVMAVLTNAEGLTIANNISGTGKGSTTSTYVVGGEGAYETTYTGTINAGNNAQHMKLTADAGGRVNFSGALSGTNANSGKYIKVGAGVVALTRAAGNTYTRDTD